MLRLLPTLIASLCALAPTYAQTLLYAKDEGTFRLVKRVIGNRPYVDNGHGTLVGAEHEFALRPVAEYLPVFVAVQNLHVGFSSAHLRSDPGANINRELHFNADFESQVPLDDVFVVLVMNPEMAEKGLFVQEIGRLGARAPRRIDVIVPVSEQLGRGHFRLHIFSAGTEVLNSQMPGPRVEHALDHIVADRLKGITDDASPQPLLGPPPEYPAKFRKAKVNGSATLSFKISPKGRIVAPVVKSATDPAFGEAALAVVPMWRFLPRVEHGKPIESTAEMPFEFNAATAN